MTNAAATSHGLESFTNTGSGEDSGVELTIRSNLGHINLRGDSGSAEFIGAAEKALGQSLPVAPNTSSSGACSIFWLGPNEWLVLPDATEVDEMLHALEGALADVHAGINVVSGGQIALSLAGADVRNLLAKGCTIDFHPREFTQGMCVQSGLAKASTVIAMPGTDEEFIVVVRRSFSAYLLRWLVDAADEYGIHVREN